MSIMRLPLLFGLVALFLVGPSVSGLPLGADRAEAQDVQVTGPLAGAPSCRGCRIYRDGRFLIKPVVGFTLQDEYTRTLFAGAHLQYHVFDWLGIGVWGGYGVLSLNTDLTDQVVAGGQTQNQLSLPSRERFADQIGRLKWIATPQLAFIPLRGKLALFQKVFVDADFHFFAGPAFIGVEERAPTTADACATDPVGCQTARESRMAIAPSFGAGLATYFNDWMGLSIEYRAFPFSWNTSGTDEGSPNNEFPDDSVDDNDRVFHYNHMVSLGLMFYMPTGIELSE